eukprot:5915733-Pleurochrysis_carterae.AAC.2
MEPRHRHKANREGYPIVDNLSPRSLRVSSLVLWLSAQHRRANLRAGTGLAGRGRCKPALRKSTNLHTDIRGDIVRDNLQAREGIAREGRAQARVAT